MSWVTGTPLYVLAVLRTLAVYRPTPIEVRVGEEVWRGDARLVAVGNGRGYGGGMKITPAAAIDDGMLDVCIVGALSRTRFLATFPKVFSGRHVTRPQVTTMRGPTVEVGSKTHGHNRCKPDGALGERRTRRPAAGTARGLACCLASDGPDDVDAARASRRERPAQLTRMVPSMPASRWPGMSQ